MKLMTDKFAVLAFALIIAVGITSSCTSGNNTGKANDNLAAAGKTEQNTLTTAENKQTENKSTGDKTAAEKEILWDFRKDDDYKFPQISKAETAAVVKYLFGDQANQNLEITSRVSGSFTKPNAKETLYFLSGCKDEETGKFATDCPHVSWNTEGWIAIYDGTTPVMKINEALGGGIEKITDVNGDGINEILSFGGYSQSGITTSNTSLGQISGGKYQNLKNFKGYADNCAFGDTLSANKKSAKAAVISYVPTTGGKIPEFSVEYFQTNCKEDSADNSSWKETGKKDFDDFFDSLS